MRPAGAGPAARRVRAARAVQPELRDAVLAWFDAEGRPLAFRETTDPWAILVSEAMAQQTQAARAAEAWRRFLGEFPTVEALAAASPAAVLRAWRGLGYNRRALALRRAAVAIVEEHGGQVPDDLDALRLLPGVGPYTARAVAALAFGRRVGAVDTNVRRVLSRAVGGRLAAFSAAVLQAVADASVPAARPGHWTHALMDVGATFCRPRAPRCSTCPAQHWCLASIAGTAEAPAPRTGRARESGRRPSDLPFRATSRWLRGRLLDALRDAPDAAWARIDAPIGEHDWPAIDGALAALAREGLAERHPSDARLARLPTD
ncbi:MAG TPA: A/G-specific adenine glycosylase [Candidatus Limnocylindrales bacterium]|nr:A/G-specific adenine glycosylase [Candidatus Limnocylindrales bacterium]